MCSVNWHYLSIYILPKKKISNKNQQINYQKINNKRNLKEITELFFKKISNILSFMSYNTFTSNNNNKKKPNQTKYGTKPTKQNPTSFVYNTV